MLPETVSYYSSVIVCKPYRNILRGSTGYGGSLLSLLKPCVEHAHSIVTDGTRGFITEQTSSAFHCSQIGRRSRLDQSEWFCRWPEVNLWVVLKIQPRPGIEPMQTLKIAYGEDSLTNWSKTRPQTFYFTHLLFVKTKPIYFLCLPTIHNPTIPLSCI